VQIYGLIIYFSNQIYFKFGFFAEKQPTP